MRDLAETASEEAAHLRAEARVRTTEARDAEVLAAAAEGRARLLGMVAARQRRYGGGEQDGIPLRAERVSSTAADSKSSDRLGDCGDGRVPDDVSASCSSMGEEVTIRASAIDEQIKRSVSVNVGLCRLMSVSVRYLLSVRFSCNTFSGFGLPILFLNLLSYVPTLNLKGC